MPKRRLNEVELVAVAERMITSYFAVILYDANIVQADVLRNRSKLGLSAPGNDLNLVTPERGNKDLLQVPIGAVHIMNVVQPELGYQPVLEGVKRALDPAFSLR